MVLTWRSASWCLGRLRGAVARPGRPRCTSYNPVTYLVEALRSLILTGWQPAVLAKGGLALAALGLISLSLAMLTFRGRVHRAR